jgi:hypothetical protein
MSSHQASKNYYMKYIRDENLKRFKKQQDLKAAFVPERKNKNLTRDEYFQMYMDKFDEDENKQKEADGKRMQQERDRIRKALDMQDAEDLIINEEHELEEHRDVVTKEP